MCITHALLALDRCGTHHVTSGHLSLSMVKEARAHGTQQPLSAVAISHHFPRGARRMAMSLLI
eukprot:4362878-Alexandrium_andersonii.AAC.1